MRLPDTAVVRSNSGQPVNIVGAGLAGALLAVMLMRHGFPVTLWDRRRDPRKSQMERGRSINLALAARGIRALEHAGLMDRVSPLLIPMRGRLVHERSGSATLQPYGQQADEVIYSVGRAALNRVLVEEAARHRNGTIRFNQTCLGAATAENMLRFRNELSGEAFEIALAPTIATDGAGSAIRQSLVVSGQITASEEWLDHDYKELTIAPVAGRAALEINALHIWPRGGFMLIALPNTDRSFTATLFLARTGARSFAALTDSQAVLDFFSREFPDVVSLIPNLAAQFETNPTGRLGTVHATPWRIGGQVLLLGDAAHAIVPFHGQGMNAAFEDCLVLDTMLAQHDDWEPLFRAFEQARRPNAAAVAQMALENYVEMRDTVLDAGFQRRKNLALELERRFPKRFIPRYAMVSFHPEIPYAEALRRGLVQDDILLELDRGSGMFDFTLAEKLINERLSALGPA